MFVTQNSQEQKWFELATENLKSAWTYCNNVEHCLELINKL